MPVSNKLTPPNFNNFPNGNHLQYGVDVIRVVEKFGAEELNIVDAFGKFKVIHTKEDALLNKISKSEYTALIKKTDEKGRDWAIMSMREINSAYLRHPDEDVVAAANRLDILFKTVGYIDLTKQSLIKQTGNTTQLLNELTGKYLEDTKKVKIEEWVEYLASCNKKIQDLMNMRIDEGALRDNTSLRGVRAERDDQYSIMAERINALSVLSPTPALELFIRTMNDITAKYGTRSKSPAGSTEGETVTEPETTVVEDKYQNAKEWTNMVNPDDFKLGDICYMVVDGVKKYYKMIDESNFNVRPNGGEGELGWEPVE